MAAVSRSRPLTEICQSRREKSVARARFLPFQRVIRALELDSIAHRQSENSPISVTLLLIAVLAVIFIRPKTGARDLGGDVARCDIRHDAKD